MTWFMKSQLKISWPGENRNHDASLKQSHEINFNHDQNHQQLFTIRLPVRFNFWLSSFLLRRWTCYSLPIGGDDHAANKLDPTQCQIYINLHLDSIASWHVSCVALRHTNVPQLLPPSYTFSASHSSYLPLQNGNSRTGTFTLIRKES